NRLTPGGVVLTKIDDQSGEVLQGAVFELQNREGETLQTGLTTGEEGKLAIDGLAPGAYQLVETQAPTGYELDATPVTFKIEKEQEAAIFLTKENRKVAGSSDTRGNKHLPKTGETIISQFILSILGVLLVFISIKFRKKRNI
ncbi:TPA: collagen binding domain-containing protein, partial [Enterococcus faecium]